MARENRWRGLLAIAFELAGDLFANHASQMVNEANTPLPHTHTHTA